MDPDKVTFETSSPSARPGMNFISADFELVTDEPAFFPPARRQSEGGAKVREAPK